MHITYEYILTRTHSHVYKYTFIYLFIHTATRVQILDETDGVFHSTNTNRERYESNYSPSSYG